MRLRYLGHSAVQLLSGNDQVLIDPFVTGNPKAAVGVDELAPTHIVVTHAHGDHWGDAADIARRTGATIVSSAEIAGYARRQGVEGHGMNTGGRHEFGFGSVTFTQAFHSSSFDDGTYGGMPMGVIVELGGVRVYHAGDTALFSDMRLIGRHGLDVALLPIGDNFTMGPDDAIEAVKLLEPKLVIPIHYDTFPLIAQDGPAFAARVEAETASRCAPLRPGESVELP
jgi:L-ascorbate metabolism protein UlaG (beta-lactamase superfamily)